MIPRFPIVARELRVAARRPATWWLRLSATLLGLGLLGMMLTVGAFNPPNGGGDGLWGLGVIMLGIAALSGAGTMAGKLQRAYSVAAMRALARRRLPRVVFDFCDGGAEDEITRERNESAFADLEFLPQPLNGTSGRDLSIELFGERLAMPLLIGPTGLSGMLWPRGEAAAARAAAKAGIGYTMSHGSTVTIEDLAVEQVQLRVEHAPRRLRHPLAHAPAPVTISSGMAASAATRMITRYTIAIAFMPRPLTCSPMYSGSFATSRIGR